MQGLVMSKEVLRTIDYRYDGNVDTPCYLNVHIEMETGREGIRLSDFVKIRLGELSFRACLV